MDHSYPYAQPVAPVLHAPDGTPYYAAPPQAAPLALHQPTAATLVPVQQHAALPAHPAAAYLPAEPGRDPWPARLLAGGIGAGAAGVGLAFLFQAIAAATTGIGLLAAVLALVWLLKNTGGGGGRAGAVNLSVNVSNRNR
ncbi:hypothetical protein [Streptomyces sp. NRRL B-24484]|uniref:hypothetical protein n=1 Tax=Streptomyces sp. NRRL B-24484 TaxID=1463833 RepID=UPI0004C16CFE|nr:hypothetical protein [Streptomyces sp. NRRL B-24484]